MSHARLISSASASETAPDVHKKRSVAWHRAMDDARRQATDLLERKALDVVLQNAQYEEFEIKPEEQEGEVATADAQAVPGEMVEPTEEAEGEEPPAQ